MKKHILLLYALLNFGLLHTNSFGQSSRYIYSIDGSEVTDTSTSLVWRRCVEGAVYVGVACVGNAAFLTYDNSLIRAREEALRTGQSWRVPNIKELASIVDRRFVSPSIDTAVFPSSLAAMFWSSTATWYVDFGAPSLNGSTNVGGTIGQSSKIASKYLRLVRDTHQ